MIRRPPRSTPCPPTPRSGSALVHQPPHRRRRAQPPLPAERPPPTRSPAAVTRLLRYLSSKVDSQSRSEEHTSELQSRQYLVCRLLLEKKKYTRKINTSYQSF